ncbi:HET-domain-containing protein [Rhizodiscina lignyota]|uniref:HET-domain-containing protein n=1 Tax=Rhizodiscina lignyota TaxID=1504668 RepID=A0A9P4I9E7_9PEZI|nr:HET-domain-containing protein [Rhizodiscina lignyota]
MRLLRSDNLKFEEFEGENIRGKDYAILSHTWDGPEVRFQDMESGPGVARRRAASYAKIQGCAEKAHIHGFDYFWVDTCCIDKQSSAELSEAINSMYNWYSNAGKCYAYLSDVPKVPWKNSRWFTRGWTLQELLAPQEVIFYDSNWRRIGTKAELANDLVEVTGISLEALSGWDPSAFPVARRMSWASKRTTTRVEDMAYCLMGIFDVNMPLLYGEGTKAFRRLQEEILKQIDDHSLFAWRAVARVAPYEYSGLLAPSPACFQDSGDISNHWHPI